MKKILSQLKPILGVAGKILILTAIVFALIQAGKNVPEKYDLKKTSVKVQGKFGHGSGNVVDTTDTESLILTNKHVCNGISVDPLLIKTQQILLQIKQYYPKCKTFPCVYEKNPMVQMIMFTLFMQLGDKIELQTANIDDMLLLIEARMRFEKKTNPIRLKFMNIDQKTLVGEIYKVSENTDLCLIKVPVGNLPVAMISNKKPKVGDKVQTIGNPHAAENHFVEGFVGNDKYIYGNFYTLITAAIYGGQSGSGTFNMVGQLVCVNTLTDPTAATIGYCIPLDDVKLFLQGSMLNRKINMEI